MTPNPKQASIAIFRHRLIRNLAAIILVMTSAHLVTEWARTRMGISGGMGLINLFALQEEANLPTIYSSFQLLMASVLLVWVSVISSQRGERFARHWKGLAAVFLYLAVDESAKLHELSIMPVLHLIDGHATGILYWPWVIPGMMFVMFLAVIYLRWFIALEPATRRVFLIAGILFVGGALGVEMAGASHVQSHGTENYTYSILVWLEETCEMTGVLVFIHGLLAHIQKFGGGLQLTISSTQAGRADGPLCPAKAPGLVPGSN
jgi:hypothetical protein